MPSTSMKHNSQSALSDLPSQGETRYRPYRWLVVIGRLGVIAALCMLGWHSLTPLYVTLRGPRMAETTVATKLRETAFAPSFDPSVLTAGDGHWVFAGLNWRVGEREVDDAMIGDVLSELKSRELTSTVESMEGEAELLASLDRLGFQEQLVDGGVWYSLDSADVRGRVLSRIKDGQQRLVAGGLAIRTEPAHWKLFELLPLPAQAAASGTGQHHLLPLPAQAQPICSRWTSQDELLAECLSVGSTPGALLKHWNGNGWTVAKNPLAGDDSFDYLCTLGAASVRAWSPGGSNRRSALLLVRLN